MGHDTIQHSPRLRKVLLRQVATIRARIGDELAFVEPLGDLEHLRSAQSELASSVDLQVGERVRKRRGLGFLLLIVSRHHRWLPRDFPTHGVSHRPREQATFRIGSRLVLLSHGPVPPKLGPVGGAERSVYPVERLRDETLDFPIAPHDETEQRRLDTTHGKHPLVPAEPGSERV